MSPKPVEPVNELAGRPRIDAVRTDIAAFIGYTAQAQSRERNLSKVPTTIGSLNEYEQFFGGPPAAGAPYLLFDSLTLFFANGGRECLIVSVGTYDDPIDKQALIDGLTPLETQPSVAIVVMPETVRLARQDGVDAQGALLAHCGDITRNRFAILDIHAGDQPLQPTNPVAPFADGLPAAHRSYGAAYYPWLIFAPPRLHGETMTIPPGGAVAGVFAVVDNTRGAWKAPANVSVSAVTGPAVSLTASDQESLISVATGVGVNGIRAFPGMGTVVWGARTLDALSFDWRYVSVRRTALMIDASVRLGLRAFVFEPNLQATWTVVRSMVQDFLMQLWRAGALPGATPQQAFSVRIGLGETMTSQDVDARHMILQMSIAFVRPAEFIVLTIDQNMSS
jgi:uncharacterized protein